MWTFQIIHGLLSTTNPHLHLTMIMGFSTCTYQDHGHLMGILISTFLHISPLAAGWPWYTMTIRMILQLVAFTFQWVWKVNSSNTFVHYFLRFHVSLHFILFYFNTVTYISHWLFSSKSVHALKIHHTLYKTKFIRIQQIKEYTLKIPGSEIDPERVHWGQTPFRVNDDPEISQLDAKCDPELDQSDPIICHVCRKLRNFRVIFGPEWSLANARWPGCF